MTDAGTESRKSKGALALLLALFGVLAWLNWPCRAPFSIDLSRETTLPARLLAGERLFVDVRYLYGPLSPTVLKYLISWWGDTLFTYYVYACALHAAVLTLFFLSCRVFLSVLPSLLAALFYLLAYLFQGPILGGAYVIPYSFAFLLALAQMSLALYGLLRFAQAPTARGAWFWFWLSAFCAGLAAVTKIEFALYSGILLLVAATLPGVRTARNLKFLAIAAGLLLIPLSSGDSRSARRAGAGHILSSPISTRRSPGSWPGCRPGTIFTPRSSAYFSNGPSGWHSSPGRTDGIVRQARRSFGGSRSSPR